MNDQPAPVDRLTDRPLSWGVSPVFLKYAVWLVLLASLSFLLVTYLCAPDQPRRTIGPILQVLVSAATLFLLSRGRIRVAFTMLVWTSWVIVTTSLVYYDGVRGTLADIYPLIIMLCGWLLGVRSAVVIAVLSVLATLGFILADYAGTLPANPPAPAVMYGLIQATCIAFSAALIVFLVRSYKQRLDDVERLSRDLALRTVEAQAIASDLNMAQSVAHTGSWVYYFATDKIEMSAETCHLFGIAEGTRETRSMYLTRVSPRRSARPERRLGRSAQRETTGQRASHSYQ